MSDLTCTFIVQKGRLYLVADVSLPGKQMFRFSNSPYDAKRFNDGHDAQEMAKLFNGVVRLYDRLNGEMI